MRRPSTSLAILILLLITAPAIAQPAAHGFSDAAGYFSIKVPSDWTAAGDASRSLGAAFIRGFEQSDGGRAVRSSLAADGPVALDAYRLPFVGMIMVDVVPGRAEDLGQRVIDHAPPGWTQTQRGQTRVAGHDAYYEYATRAGLYAVILFIKQTPTTGFIVMAGTQNTPDRVDADFKTISQILESLHAR